MYLDPPWPFEIDPKALTELWEEQVPLCMFLASETSPRLLMTERYPVPVCPARPRALRRTDNVVATLRSTTWHFIHYGIPPAMWLPIHQYTFLGMPLARRRPGWCPTAPAPLMSVTISCRIFIQRRHYSSGT